MSPLFLDKCCRPLAWKLCFQANSRQHLQCITPQAVTHSLVLLRMGEIIARNMLSWLELLTNRYCCNKLVVYIIVSVMHGQANIIFSDERSICITYCHMFSRRVIGRV